MVGDGGLSIIGAESGERGGPNLTKQYGKKGYHCMFRI